MRTTNLQGDVVAILNSSGQVVVQYTYDAWGNPLSTTGSLASTIGTLNPIRYRGYVYDTETGLYYLQSRYYDPELGRFINADAFVSTGQGLLGNNMFAYCGNNPVNYVDPSGCFFNKIADLIKKTVENVEEMLEEGVEAFTNEDPQVAAQKKPITFYNGVPIIRVPFMEDCAFSFGVIFMASNVEDPALVQHEYGHVVHLSQIGVLKYASYVVIPSIISYHLNKDNKDFNYYSQPYEYIADRLGQVDPGERNYLPHSEFGGILYYILSIF